MDLDGPRGKESIWSSWWRCEIDAVITDPAALEHLREGCRVRIDPMAFRDGKTAFEYDVGDTNEGELQTFICALRVQHPDVKVHLFVGDQKITITEDPCH
jgi:hypothetical protein